MGIYAAEAAELIADWPLLTDAQIAAVRVVWLPAQARLEADRDTQAGAA